jgi:hypothetical protein
MMRGLKDAADGDVADEDRLAVSPMMRGLKRIGDQGAEVAQRGQHVERLPR